MNPTRQQILDALATLSRLYPEMRFGQLVVNISNWAAQMPDATWDVEDEAFLEAAKRQVDLRGETVATTNGTAASTAIVGRPG